MNIFGYLSEGPRSIALVLLPFILLFLSVSDIEKAETIKGDVFSSFLIPEAIDSLLPSLSELDPYRDYNLLLLDRNITIAEPVRVNASNFSMNGISIRSGNDLDKDGRAKILAYNHPYPSLRQPSYFKQSSSWFPSVPAKYCTGLFGMTIEGNLIINKDSQLKKGKNTIKIDLFSRNLSPIELNDQIFGKVTLDNKVSDNRESSRFDVEKISNSCQVLLYTRN